MVIRVNFKIIPLKWPDYEYKDLKTSGPDGIESEHLYSASVELASVVFKSSDDATVLRLLNSFSSTKSIDKNRLELYLPSPKYKRIHHENETYGGYYSYERIYGEKLDDYTFLEPHSDKILLLYIHQKRAGELYIPLIVPSRDDEIFLEPIHAWKCRCPEEIFDALSAEP